MNTRRDVLLGIGAVMLGACAAGSGTGVSGVPTVAANGGGGVPPIELLRKAGRVAGGRRGLALLSPYSSRNQNKMMEYARWQFDIAGLRSPTILRLDGSAIELVQQASYISFSGGIQNHQMRALRGVSGLLQALRDAHQRGCIMEGGSAGAAVMSRLMISGGSRGTAYTRTGIGFLPDVVLDQHVVARSREWRLKQVIGKNRSKLGVGLDEESGILVQGRQFTVYGKSQVIVTKWEDGQLHEERLRRGDRYDLDARAQV